MEITRRRIIKSISPIGGLAVTVYNIVDEGSLVNGIKRTIKEELTEDNIITAPFYQLGKKEGYREGERDGYIRCSREYEEKLRRQAELFLHTSNKWKKEKAEYEALLDEYELTIAELEAQISRTNSGEYKKRLSNVKNYQRKLADLAN